MDLDSLKNQKFATISLASLQFPELAVRVNDAIKRGQTVTQIGYCNDRHNPNYKKYWARMKLPERTDT